MNAKPRYARLSDTLCLTPTGYARHDARYAIMAGGWTRDGAVQDQIDDTIADAVMAARARLAGGADSAEDCDDCGEAIPRRRRAAMPGVRTCIACQSARDSRPSAQLFNRRGSKDSQLR